MSDLNINLDFYLFLSLFFFLFLSFLFCIHFASVSLINDSHLLTPPALLMKYNSLLKDIHLCRSIPLTQLL